MQLPHHFKKITLHLARSREHPDGSNRHGYDIVAPLTPEGRFDLEACHRHPEACRVHRFWAGEPDQIGRLRHRAGGAGGSTWVFDYDAAQDDDDEAGYRLGDHVMQTGEYVSVRDDGGEMHTFRIVSVQNAT